MMCFCYSYRVATWKIKITDIPVGVFIHNLLPLCKIKDALSLGCTNKFFALVVAVRVKQPLDLLVFRG